jgi:hypothetical protein
MNRYELSQLTDWEEERYQDSTYARAQQQLKDAVAALLDIGESWVALHDLVDEACDAYKREASR